MLPQWYQVAYVQKQTLFKHVIIIDNVSTRLNSRNKLINLYWFMDTPILDL